MQTADDTRVQHTFLWLKACKPSRADSSSALQQLCLIIHHRHQYVYFGWVDLGETTNKMLVFHIDLRTDQRTRVKFTLWLQLIVEYNVSVNISMFQIKNKNNCSLLTKLTLLKSRFLIKCRENFVTCIEM